MPVYDYNRLSAIRYAERWAKSRNPSFYNFDDIGGDCTNFVSQCVYAGSKVMNYTPIVGWYYNSAYDRTASWTGVEFFYKYITGNDRNGPFANLVSASDIQIGDVIQLGRFDGSFYHTLLVTDISDGRIFVSAHTLDAFNRALDSYFYERIRFLHILGVIKN